MTVADQQTVEAGLSGLQLLCFWILPALLAGSHVYYECRKLGEPAGFNVSGTFLLWPLFYLGWILWWPGSLRLWLSGRSVNDLQQAKNIRRVRERQLGNKGQD